MEREQRRECSKHDFLRETGRDQFNSYRAAGCVLPPQFQICRARACDAIALRRPWLFILRFVPGLRRSVSRCANRDRRRAFRLYRHRVCNPPPMLALAVLFLSSIRNGRTPCWGASLKETRRGSVRADGRCALETLSFRFSRCTRRRGLASMHATPSLRVAFARRPRREVPRPRPGPRVAGRFSMHDLLPMCTSK